MPSYQPHDHTCPFQQPLAPFLQAEGLPFAQVLTADDIAQACADEQVAFGQTARSFWTAPLTLWAFLSQALAEDKSCRQAVASVVVYLALSCPPDDLDTAAYCRARAKLPATVLCRLAVQVGRRLERAAPAEWLWCGRHAFLADGSTSSLPDTDENQAAFPQSKTQQRGLGYPLMRWVVLVALATATVQDLAYGPYQGKETGETALCRQVLAGLLAGDILVADRYYCSYWLVALLAGRGVDVVFRLHQRRKYDFRRGRHLGPGDHVVTWQRPPKPKWLTAEEYAEIPETLTVREVRVRVTAPGCRVRELILATTMLDAATYALEDIGDLYHKRWQIELDIRALKTTLHLDQLRCKTPFMVAKEIWVQVLAYNLIRKVSAQAAQLAGLHPRDVSFKATLQVVRGGWQQLTTTTGDAYVRLAHVLLQALRKQRVGHRPDRCEPRAVKRRPKPHKLLREPRATAQAKLLRGRRRPKKTKKTR